ncbi:MAG: Bax inhibitor-1/YccA family protein [Devosia nanyangense]|uniref:Bax inhibitor-1/YccA family protein n=1 Tax=Devosia nanyangense TaxID=1228055 RepID=A0A933L2X4_9HYPH|nr:Bax inhibitor-1/YccA family protein [Devosia nanyangense]
MAEFDRPSVAARPATAAVIDQGLRSYMLRVYNYMGLGLVVTGLVAYFTYTASFVEQGGQIVGMTSLGAALFNSPLQWVIMLAPLAFVLVLSFGITKLSVPVTQILFWAFAAVMGLSLSSIFAVYTGGSIAKVFFISAGTFGAMSLYGYTTKRDLTQFGSFLIMGLFGLIIASIANIFFNSGPLGFAISILGVLIFVGLTAWDTQRIKESYNVGFGADVLAKGAIMGALSLYLDFINLFLMLLRLFGNQRS